MTATIQPLEVPPVDFGDDIRYRSCRKAIRRTIAEWLRTEGLPATGATWEAAWLGAERDVSVLAELARAERTLPSRLDALVSPAVLLSGDYLPELGAHVVSVLRDPDTGAYWLTVRRVTETAGARDEYRATTTALEDVEIVGRVHAVRKPVKR